MDSSRKAVPKGQQTKPRDFAEYRAQYRDLVYQTICRYLPIPSPKELRRGETDLTSTAMHLKITREYVDRRGKYMRPGLLLLSGQMFGANMDDLILLAAAQQLSEDFLLMKDDWEDASKERRGLPAAHLMYGAKRTINASVACMLAVEHILADYQDLHPGIGIQVHHKFIDMLNRTLEGVFIELRFFEDIRSLASASEELYLSTVIGKTCYYSVYGPLQIGAIAAGKGDPETLRILETIGTEAGIAFQMMDDILDLEAKASSGFGKERYGDIYEGKLTIPVLHAYRHGTREEGQRLETIYKKQRKAPEQESLLRNVSPDARDELEGGLFRSGEDVRFVVEMVHKHHSLGYAHRLCEKHAERAEKLLKKYERALPQNEYTEMLKEVFRNLHVRTR